MSRAAGLSARVLGWAVATATAAACGSAFAGDFAGLRQSMSAEEFERAGLVKLTPDELSQLDGWVQARLSAPAAAAVAPATEGPIEARVLEPFDGWSGKTVFRLDNGQVWRQRLPGRYSYRGDDRTVVIDRNALGFFRLTVTATGRSVGVEPVR